MRGAAGAPARRGASQSAAPPLAATCRRGAALPAPRQSAAAAVGRRAPPPSMRRASAAAAAAAAMPADVAAALAAWEALDADGAGGGGELRAMAAAADWPGLRERLCGRLEFGTAGLRAKMGAGFTRMNSITVQQTTQGLLTYLEAAAPGALASGGLVVGHDARHNSAVFARLVAACCAARGVRAHLFAGLAPTPFVANAAKQLGAAAGVMVTASHNQKEYNGYKARRWHRRLPLAVPRANALRRGNPSGARRPAPSPP